MTIAKHYKCGVCGWVHVELSLDAAKEYTDAVNAALSGDGKPVALERYFVCGRCGASSEAFVPAVPGDAPPLSTLLGAVLQSTKERNIAILRGLTKPQTRAESERLADERMREMLLRQGRTVAEVDALLSRKEQEKCEVCVYEQHETADGRIVTSRTCVRCGASSAER